MVMAREEFRYPLKKEQKKFLKELVRWVRADKFVLYTHEIEKILKNGYYYDKDRVMLNIQREHRGFIMRTDMGTWNGKKMIS
jgi:hypothetical protein